MNLDDPATGTPNELSLEPPANAEIDRYRHFWKRPDRDSQPPAELPLNTAPFLYATERIYPFRELLHDPTDVGLVQTTVRNQVRMLLNGPEEPPLSRLTADVQAMLCGPEPLYPDELLTFLRAVAITILEILFETASRNSELPESELPISGSLKMSEEVLSLYDAGRFPSQMLDRLRSLERQIGSNPVNANLFYLHFLACVPVRPLALILNRSEIELSNILAGARTELFFPDAKRP